jgi:hypothetical protein
VSREREKSETRSGKGLPCEDTWGTFERRNERIKEQHRNVVEENKR